MNDKDFLKRLSEAGIAGMKGGTRLNKIFITKKKEIIMKEMFKNTIDSLAAVKKVSKMKISRSFVDFFKDRIRQASSKPTLEGFMQYFIELMGAEIGYIKREEYKKFLTAANSEYADSILQWIRGNPTITAMLCNISEEERAEYLPEINVEAQKETGSALPLINGDIRVSIKCLSQLSHGDDHKSGNATLFRRMQVLSDTNQIIELPYYAGNAWRGQMRDLLGDYMLTQLGISTNRIEPVLALWFFHVLYSGGSLSETTTEEIKMMRELGKAGINTDGMNKVRNYFPHLSILGFMLGNKGVPGRIYVNDLRPVCREWGFETDLSVDSIMTWLYSTRREDLQIVESDEKIKNESMIVNTECIMAGTEMFGVIDISPHANELERSALFNGLELLKKDGMLGGSNRQGYGKIELSYETDMDYDIKLYPAYLNENKEDITNFMKGIGAFKLQEEKEII